MIKNHLESERLKGKLRGYTDSHFNARSFFGFGKREKGSLDKKVARKLNEAGYLVEQCEYGINDKLTLSIIITYNLDKGTAEIKALTNGEHPAYEMKAIHEAESATYDIISHHPKGDVVTKQVYSFDNHGNVIKKAFYNRKGILELIQTFIHDERNLPVEAQTSYGEGKLYFKYLYTYDEHGNEIESARYSTNRLTEKYTMEYGDFDKYGNWLKSKTFLNGKLIGFTERQVEYYDK